MKKIAVLLLLFSTILVKADVEIFELKKPMRCSKVQFLIDYLTNDYAEKLFWIGQEDSTYTYIAIYKNSESGTWSIIQYDSSIGCFLGHGKQSSAI